MKDVFKLSDNSFCFLDHTLLREEGQVFLLDSCYLWTENNNTVTVTVIRLFLFFIGNNKCKKKVFVKETLQKKRLYS